MQNGKSISFSGYVTVVVDEVDMEQFAIEHPGFADARPQVIAFAAAQEKDDFKAIARVLERNGQALEPDDWKHGNGKYDVIFITRQRLRDSEVAA